MAAAFLSTDARRKTGEQMIAVIGASGFIGKELLRRLAIRSDLRIRAMVRGEQNEIQVKGSNIEVVRGDMREHASMRALLEPDCIVVNLAYLSSKSNDENLVAMCDLADACASAHVKRLVHCSTATVVGGVQDSEITEETQCEPKSEYERTKLEIENVLLGKAANRFEVVILRPTAVFGPNGKNLLKVANDLMLGNSIVNYIRSCLYGHRKMNLVCVDNVASALVFLAEKDRPVDRQIFIISDDEDLGNNYRNIEKYLIKTLGYKDYWLPPVALPQSVLSMILKLTRRSNTNPNRVYSSGKLVAAGFKKAVSFEMGLELFATWYRGELLSNK